MRVDETEALDDVFARARAMPGERPFVTVSSGDDDYACTTFGEFRRLMAGTARFLRQHGVRARDHVVLVLPQDVPLMAVFAAAIELGAVPTILAYPNFKLDPAKYRRGLTGICERLSARVVVIDGLFPEALKAELRGTAAPLVELPSSLESDESEFVPGRVHDPKDEIFLQHSSGTTGMQKGVAVTHGALLTQLRHLAHALRIVSSDCVYSWLPLYHDMGLVTSFLLPIAYGLPIVMQSPESWVMQPASMLDLIERFRCTLAWVPNFALSHLARHVPPASREGRTLSSLRALVNCSEPVRAADMDAFASVYAQSGFQRSALHSSYAMAENVFAVTQSSLESGPARLWVDRRVLASRGVAEIVAPDHSDAVCLVSSGPCLEGNVVRIDDSRGLPVGDRVVGEIMIQSDSLFAGYDGQVELNESVLRNGWFQTGDLGFLSNNELFVSGRSKDLIIIAGQNIHPQDVELIACEQPTVRDGRSVALSVPNPSTGTDDLIVVVEVAADVDGEQATGLERSIRRDVMAALQVSVKSVFIKPPRWIVKSTSGKPARRETLSRLLSDHPEMRS